MFPRSIKELFSQTLFISVLTGCTTQGKQSIVSETHGFLVSVRASFCGRDSLARYFSVFSHIQMDYNTISAGDMESRRDALSHC